MVREISEKEKFKRKLISGVVIFFMIIGITLILVGFYVHISGPYYYTNYKYAQLLLSVGAAITFLAVICGVVVTFKNKIISKIYIIIFVIIFINGIIIYSVGLYLYVDGMEIWWWEGAIPPLPDTVKIAVNLVLTGGVIAILEIVSVTVALIYAIRKK